MGHCWLDGWFEGHLPVSLSVGCSLCLPLSLKRAGQEALWGRRLHCLQCQAFGLVCL